MPVRDLLRPDRPPTPADDRVAALPGWARSVTVPLGAGLASAALLVAAVFVVWLARSAGPSAGWEAVAAGLGAWLFAHGATLHAGGARVSLTPWLLTALPFLCAWGAAARLVADLGENPRRLTGFGGLRRDAAVGAAVFVVAYAALAVVVALLARLGGVSVGLLGAVVGPALLALVAYTLALGRRFGLAELAPRAAWARDEYVPTWVRAAFRPAGWGMLAAVGAGLLLAAGALVAGGSRAADLYGLLSPGAVGGAALVLAQLAYAPTAAVWGLAWAAGPGFSIGAGTSFTWLAAQPGVLPLVPALGALPPDGPMPPWAPLALAVPVLAGVLLGVRAVRAAGKAASWAERARVAGAAVLLATAGLGLAAAAASGSVGASRLAHVGVDVVPVTAALAGELALGAAFALAVASLSVTRAPSRVRRLLPQRRTRREARERRSDPR